MYRTSSSSFPSPSFGKSNSGLPPAVEAELASQTASSSELTPALLSAVETAVAECLAKLVQTPVEKVKPNTKLADLGMDSMLAVEARQTACWGVEVGMMEVVSKGATVGGLVRKVAEGLVGKIGKGKDREAE
ncbi:MAG: hypothetical protein Q9165_008122 [Trypethelium subeluteriae]